jgi:hypothetical protein
MLPLSPKKNDLRWKIIWHASPPGAMAFRSLFGRAKGPRFQLVGLVTHWFSATWPWEVSLLHWRGPLSVLCLAIDFFFFPHYQPTQKGERKSTFSR